MWSPWEARGECEARETGKSAALEEVLVNRGQVRCGRAGAPLRLAFSLSIRPDRPVMYSEEVIHTRPLELNPFFIFAEMHKLYFDYCSYVCVFPFLSCDG